MKSIPLTDELYDYMLGVSLVDTPVMKELRAVTARMPAGGMQIAPEQGQFMQFLVRLLNARRCLEVGCFTGYSALVVALALPPDGRLITCDISREWTDIARQHWQRAGVDGKIDLRLGPALDTLQEMLCAGQGASFDFAFIDADKNNYAPYYELCLELLRPGGVILIDNTLWGGQVANSEVTDADTEGIRAVNRMIFADSRVNSCLIPVSDGLHICHKL